MPERDLYGPIGQIKPPDQDPRPILRRALDGTPCRERFWGLRSLSVVRQLLVHVRILRSPDEKKELTRAGRFTVHRLSQLPRRRTRLLAAELGNTRQRT